MLSSSEHEDEWEPEIVAALVESFTAPARTYIRVRMNDEPIPNPFVGIACRDCGARTLRLEVRIELAGDAVLDERGGFPATQWPFCVCDSCHSESRGKL
jgi:hypothetical protein